MTIQFPKRRETDEQAKERVEEITLNNAVYDCDEHGNPVTKEGNRLKNLTKKQLEIFRSIGR